MKRLPFLPPLLLAASSPVVLYVSMLNVTIFIPPRDVLLPVIFAMLLGALLFILAYALSRDLQAAGLIASLLVLGLLYIWPLFLAILGILLLGILFARLVLKKLGFEQVNLVLLIVCLITGGFYFLRFGSFVFQDRDGIGEVGLVQPVSSPGDLHPAGASRPDIYYIILDGYGRPDMLQALHGYDDSSFLAGLEQRGFSIASQSQANYPRTLQSLASSMNMQYLDDLPVGFQDSNLWWLLMDTIHHSQVRQYLEASGYRTVFLSSGWDFSDIRDGDVYLSPYPVMLDNFESAFISWTNLRFLGGLAWTGISFPSTNESRRVIRFNFEALPETASLTGPKFVFAHIVAPHPPFLFNSRGEPVDLGHLSPSFGVQVDPQQVAAYRAAYLDQLAFVNRETLKMLDALLANSSASPVIVLQADHGPDVFMNFDDPALACLYERYSILTALHLPGDPVGTLPPDLGPVNTFRFLFDAYFQAGFELLPERQFFSTNAQPYLFQDVTADSRAACSIPSDLLP